MTEERKFDLFDEAGDIYKEIGKILERFDDLKRGMLKSEFEELMEDEDDCVFELLDKINRIW